MRRIVLDTNCLLRSIPNYRFRLIQSDVDDNKFVDCAITAGADYLVSDDAHFAVLNQIPFPKVNLIRLEFFCDIIKCYQSNEDNTKTLNEPMPTYR